MTDDARGRIAYHEAAHAVVAHLLGREVDSVSIEPTEHYAGVTISATRYGGPRLEADRLPIDQPPEARRQLEGNVLILVAGGEAADLAFPQSGFGFDTQTTLVHGASREGLDFDVAHEIAFQLSGLEAAKYLSWLRALTRRLVREHWPAVTALAEELRQRKVIDGESAASIIEKAQGEAHPSTTSTPTKEKPQ